MTSGSVIIMGKAGGILPSFSFRDLKKKAKIKGEKVMGPFYLFSGDVNENGDGRLYLSKENNSDLSWNERYLEVIE